MTTDWTMDDLFLAYAAGRLAEPAELAVATHLAMSPDGRGRVLMLETIGGVLLDDELPAELAPDAMERMLDRLDRDPPPAPAAPPPADTPAPLALYLPQGLRNVQWKKRGPIQEAMLDMADSSHTVRLLKLTPGRRLPTHTHEGYELTVVLEGAFHDETGQYRKGDIAIADRSIEHSPVVDGTSDCICLAVNDAPLRLTGLGRLLNPFIRL